MHILMGFGYGNYPCQMVNVCVKKKKKKKIDIFMFFPDLLDAFSRNVHTLKKLVFMF